MNQAEPIIDIPDKQGRYAIYACTLLSSLLLLIIHKGISAESAFFESPALRCAWYSISIGAPFVVVFLIRSMSEALPWVAAGLIGILLGLTGWYTGSAYLPDMHMNPASIFVPYTICIVIAVFVLLPVLRLSRDDRASWHYARLFQLTEDHGLALQAAIAFTAAGWLILWLMAALFSVIGIDFFKDLFDETEFIYPVSGLFVGFGIGLGRSQIGAVRSVLKVGKSLARPLLPLISGISLLFLTALIFNDLQPLWDTGRATVLLLCLILGTIILLNAVYQDGSQAGSYGRGLRNLINSNLIILPFFSGIAIYAISLRVGQYGWTVDRAYASLVTLLTTLYTIGYAASAIHNLFSTSHWLAWISRINTGMTFLIPAVLILCQTPIMDFRELTVRNQLERYSHSVDDLNRLDLRYFRFELGKPGYDALKNLRAQDESELPPNFHSRLDDVLNATNRFQAPGSNLLLTQIESGQVSVYPANSSIPDDLKNYLASMGNDRALIVPNNSSCSSIPNQCSMIAIDLNQNGTNEWVFLDTSMYNCRATVFGNPSGKWEFIGFLNTLSACNGSLATEALKSGNFAASSPEISNLRIGTEVLQFQPGPKMP